MVRRKLPGRRAWATDPPLRGASASSKTSIVLDLPASLVRASLGLSQPRIEVSAISGTTLTPHWKSPEAVISPLGSSSTRT